MNRSHILLDGKPYMLAANPTGGVYSGNSAAYSGPWANQISQGPRAYHDMSETNVQVWSEMTGGSGQTHKGTDVKKYAKGTADTRSGNVMLAPKYHGSTAYLGAWLPEDGRVATHAAVSTTFGPLYQVYSYFNNVATVPVQTVGALVRRVASTDYAHHNGLYCKIKQGPFTKLTATVDLLDKLPEVGVYHWVNFIAPSVEYMPAATLTVELGCMGNPVEYACTATGGIGAATAVPFFKLKHYNDPIDGPPSAIEEFKGMDGQRFTYAGVNKRLLRWERSGGWQNVKSDFTGEIKDMAVFEYGAARALVVAQGGSLPIYHYNGTTDTGTWTNGSVGAQRLLVHDDLLWRAQGNELSASTQLETWGVSAKVGYHGDDIIAMASQAGKLFAQTQRGVYEITYPAEYPAPGDDSYTPISTLVVPLRTEPVPHTYKAMVPWQGGLVWPGWYSLQRYQSGLVDPIGLGTGQPVLEEDRAQVYALHPTSKGLYVAMSDGDFSYNQVMMYQQLTDQAGWHPLFRHTTRAEECRLVYLDPNEFKPGAGRLWFSAGWNLCYIDDPLWTQARNLWSDADWQQNSYIEYTQWDDGRLAMSKDFVKVRVRAWNMNQWHPITIYWTEDSPLEPSPTWATLGQVATNGVTDMHFPTGSLGESLRLKAHLEYQNYTVPATPILESLELWTRDIVPAMHTVRYQLSVDRQQQLEHGVRDVRSTREMLEDLEALRNRHEGFELVDELGRSWQVRITHIASQIREMRQQQTDSPEPAYVVQVDALVLNELDTRAAQG